MFFLDTRISIFSLCHFADVSSYADTLWMRMRMFDTSVTELYLHCTSAYYKAFRHVETLFVQGRNLGPTRPVLVGGR